MPTKYGILDSRDLVRTVAVITERNLAGAIRQYLDAYNTALNNFLGQYASRTTDHQERYYLGGQAGRLRPSDEYSRGLISRRPEMTYFDVAYPIKQWDDRLGWTQLFLAKATGESINRDFLASQERDRNTMLAELLSAVFYKTNYTWADDEWGTLTINRLLNGDGTVPPPFGGKTFLSTHNHYLATNGALTAAFYATVYEHLREHGHGGNVVVEIARNLAATTQGLTGFAPALSTQDQRLNLTTSAQVVTSDVQDARAIGRIANMEIRINDSFPDNYAFATDLASDPPIAMREDPEAALRGYQLTQDNPDDNHPLRNAWFIRRAGFGVRNRSNGVMVFVDAGATYTDPASL